MNEERQAILEDLALFADLGTHPPVPVESGDMMILRLTRNGNEKEIVIYSDGRVRESGDVERSHVNFQALIASPSFSDLGKWAENQRVQLKPRVTQETLRTVGSYRLSESSLGVEEFDDSLVTIPDGRGARVSITLVNGPAGIGKTSFIRSLAYARASRYRLVGRPLVLHVESRGRVLQNLTDLMAFSLQTLRVPVTYDQIPALVRLGLVTLAIDGFDELGDPSGYDLAWAQVNDLVTSSRGKGKLVLAGRETFISEERIQVALTSLDSAKDRLNVFSLCPLRPADAKTWLENAGWPVSLLESESVEPLFEQGSYALKPFFISELARVEVVTQIGNGLIEDLLSFLITAMLERETKKFGRDIEVATSFDDRKNFIVRLMEEIARDLAENQTDALSAETVIWLAEMVASDLVTDNLTGILKNRSSVIAFLMDDDRRGYRRFVHDQVASFFLSQVTIKAISRDELPKFIRRNIFGVDFLENFCSVVRHLNIQEVDQFINAAIRSLNKSGDNDRSRRNLAGLIFATCSVCSPTKTPLISDVSLDEVYFTESACKIILKRVTIGQLVVKEADIRSVEFDKECFIASMIADDATIPSTSMPEPAVISLPGRVLTKTDHKASWFDERLAPFKQKISGTDLQNALKRLSLFNLLGRVARYKPFWLKDGDERAARRILDDPNWEVLRDLMLKHDLLLERRDVQSSGRPGSFFHVRNRHWLLLLDQPPKSVRAFVADLLLKQVELDGFLETP